MSLPARGAWIEIAISVTEDGQVDSRSPRGERGLKSEVEENGNTSLVAPREGSVD